MSSSVASRVQYMHDQEKLAMDLNWEFLWLWDESAFLTLGSLERRQMDELLTLMAAYGLEPLVTSRSEAVYGDSEHEQAYTQLRDRGSVSLLEAYSAMAYMEEWDISEISDLMDSTNDQAVTDTLTKLLAGAKSHLRLLASRIAGLGYAYQAQLLSQPDVDQICGNIEPWTGTEFTLNSGLNDAWYYPFTSGQGFFISVYPDARSVSVSWLSYDTAYQAGGGTIGNAGQRWLVAQGSYDGNRADLDIYSASGGLFDQVGSAPELENVGYMTLQFEDCASGSIRYLLWPLFGGYFIPIQRVASDNVAQCELNASQ